MSCFDSCALFRPGPRHQGHNIHMDTPNNVLQLCTNVSEQAMTDLGTLYILLISAGGQNIPETSDASSNVLALGSL